MTEYKLDPRSFSMMRRKILLVLVPIFVAMLGVALFVVGGISLGAEPWFVWVGAAAVLLLVCGIGGLIAMRRAMRSLASFRIVLDAEGVTQVRDGRELRIRYGEITGIKSGGGMEIQTSDRLRFIGVPPTLERFDEFRLALAQRHPIDEVPPRRVTNNRALSIAVVLLLLAVVVVFFVATNRYVIIAASVVLLLNTVWLAIARRRGISSTPWWTIIFLALLIVGRAVLAIVGY